MAGTSRRKEKDGTAADPKTVDPKKDSGAGGAKKEADVMLVDAPDRWTKWWTRTWWTLIMVGGFTAIIYFGGHLALCGLVLALQIFGFRELMAIRHNRIDVRLSADSVPVYKFLDVFGSSTASTPTGWASSNGTPHSANRASTSCTWPASANREST